MKVVDSAIRYPVTTAVAVLLLALFGTLALLRIPVQLTPTVEEPEITVQTFWPGASPAEVERELIDEQEEQLKSLEGLIRMESSSDDSSGQIILTFQTGTEVDAALLRVSNRLDQVPSYPPDADKPVLLTVNPNSNAIAWFALIPAGDEPFTGDISTQYDFAVDHLKPEFERVPGIANSNAFGGRESEMQVVADPEKLAARGITLNELARALDRENRNYSGGDFSEGKRRYVVRTIGEYGSAADIEEVVIAVRNGVPVRVGDVAEARLGYAKPIALAFQRGEPMIAMNAIREANSNVLDVMRQLRGVVARLNDETLAPRGLQLLQVYDETEYIVSAIDLVKQSLFLGAILAVIILLLFLRSFSSTLVIAVAIPISVVGTFLLMNALGRTINVISLAGMAFAVGMVVDGSIVVLENIYRHRQLGKSRREAAYDGTVEVWGAVLASSLTTIAVFVPVVFVREEAGQLFRDIAIAISCAVGLSLIVAITVIPSLAAKVLRAASSDPGRRGFHSLWGGVPLAGRVADGIASSIHWLTGSTARRLMIVIGFTATAIGLSAALVPKAEYLPTGNRNFLFGLVLPPPGYNLDEVADLRSPYTEALSHLWQGEGVLPDLPGGGIDNWFYVALNNMAFQGARSRDPGRTRELLPEFGRVSGSIPGAIAFMAPASIFQRGFLEGRNIDIELSGPELEHLIRIGQGVFGRLQTAIPGSQARPVPSLDLGNPEIRVLTDRRRAADLGITNRDLGLVVSALIDGAKVSEYRHEGTEIDLKLLAVDGERRTHLIDQLPIATPAGRVVTLGSVAEVSLVTGPVSIRHVERERSIAIQVTPPETLPLQEAMEIIERDIIEPMRADGTIGGLYDAQLSGTADKLTQTGRALFWNFVLAVVITYLLMAALFEDFLYPLVIMFSVPLAALGGFLGLAAVNRLIGYQALDVLTMLGFIILVGTVVNNAILIVHQTLHHLRTGDMTAREAIREATRIRVRPIFMSVGTSICGMLPLVLFPGAGSELYRGLGSVVIGGLAVSTVFTLFLVPALLSLVLDARAAARRWWDRRREAVATP